MSSATGRVLATFAVLQAAGGPMVGTEACALDAADGSLHWCTQVFQGGSAPTAAASALSDDGKALVAHVTGVGVLLVDAASAAAPTIRLLHDTSANCCAATALAIAGDVVVLSLPDGVMQPPWCNGRGSQLMGLQMS